MRPVLISAFVLVAACGGGGSDEPAVEVTTTATSTASTSSTTTTATAPPQTPLPTGEEAVQAVMAAWQAGDRASASLVATPSAVDALFAVAPEPTESRGCNSPEVNPRISCVFRLSTGELQVRASPTPDGTGYLVDFVLLGS